MLGQNFSMQDLIFGQNTGKYGPEKNQHLDTFHRVTIVLYVLFLSLLPPFPERGVFILVNKNTLKVVK